MADLSIGSMKTMFVRIVLRNQTIPVARTFQEETFATLIPLTLLMILM